MKIYTKTGDQGETSLASGIRVKKWDPRLEAYGTVDELNASIGLIISEEDIPMLTKIQNQLYIIGGMLATDPESWEHYWNTSDIKGYITELENNIDKLSLELPSLRNFILPQGSRAIACVHLSRTICRRAERNVSQISEQKDIYLLLLQYLNRLSDYFFILARYLHKIHNISEIHWKSDK